MKLEVGEYYLTKKGAILINNDYIEKYYKDSIVAHIPKQLLNHLIVEINNYHTDSDFRKVVDNVYGKS